MTYEADEAGVLAIVATEGSTVAVGAPIATIGDAAPAASSNGAAARQRPERRRPAAEAQPPWHPRRPHRAIGAKATA